MTVTLSGSKVTTQTVVTSEGGNFRFLNLPVGRDYILKCELSGFQNVIREQLILSYGRDVELTIIMPLARLSEEVVVTGQTPIIDRKRAQVGVNVTKEMIEKLPTARNPWVIMAMIPGMLIDREDVGGNEAGQQSNYHGHGSSPNDNTWNVDGANITDNSALGSSPAYLNVTSYEELQINYGNNDIRVQTGGVQINLVSKRGMNRYSGTFYLDAVRSPWQSDNVSDELKDIGYTAAGLNKLYFYGANFGGPLLKDRLWFYGSWGIQDIDARTLAGGSDKTWLASGYARMDFQLDRTTRANFFLEYDNKQKWGRAWVGYTQQDQDTLWNQVGPSYIYKGEVEKSFGSNFYMNAKVIYTDGGFALNPIKSHTTDGSGDVMQWSYFPTFYMSGNTRNYYTDRDSINFNVSGNYFLENFLGADHEIVVGVDYQSAQTSTFLGYEGNVIKAYFGPDSSMPTGEYWEAWVVRNYINNYDFKRYSAFIQDTFSIGRLSATIGVRYDNEKSKVKNLEIPASLLMANFMPAVSLSEFDPGVNWSVFSPRLSLSYDLFGNGRDVIKLAVARYGSQSGNTLADFINPVGYSEIDVIWQDLNGDGRVTDDELFGQDWNTGALVPASNPDYWIWSSSAVNAENPTSIQAMNRFDPNYNSPILDEVSLAYQKELFADFMMGLELFYKKYHNQTWIRSMMADGTLETEDNYYVAGQSEDTGHDYYGRYQRFPYRYRTNHEEAYDRYLGAQLVFNKRLSNGWMLNGAFTWSDWKRYYNGEYLGVIENITDGEMTDGMNNVDYFDGGVVAPETSGSGMTGIFVNSRWNFKLAGLVVLPLNFNLSGVFQAREGYPMAPYDIVNVPGIGQVTLYGNPDQPGGKFGDNRLPAFWMANLRLEKDFRVSDTSYVTLSADAFNLTNSAHHLQEEDRMTAANFQQALRILNPRVFRFGIRFTF